MFSFPETSIGKSKNGMIALFGHKHRLTEREFDELFREEYPRLYRLAYSLLNDAEDSRDVVSGVFADLLDRQKLTADNPAGYLMAMVRNRSVDLLRHRRVEDEVRQELLREYRVYTSADGHDERISEIRQFIQSELTPQTRRVLGLCYDEKKTYQEVAAELGISVQAVNKHISAALRKLRERFNPAILQPSKTN